MGDPGQETLNDFYARTAGDYDQQHELEREHVVGLQAMSAFMQRLGVRSVLDVGCGTGRAIRALSAAMPGLEITGVDPSPDLLEIATTQHGIPSDRLQLGHGEHLPFESGSFDAVMAVAVLHHIQDPRPVVAEMTRVARMCVFISDVNVYGSGSLPARVIKTAAHQVGLSSQLQRLRHGPSRSFTNEGDGTAYPFSVFDVLDQIRAAFPTVVSMPTRGAGLMHAYPLFAATNLVVGGYRLASGADQ